MYRLLIVDDEPIIVDGLHEMFAEFEGCPLEVVTAYNGKKALDISRRMRIDLLLTDIEMPGMNGIELHRQVRRIWPRCKAVFLTGYNHFDYIQASIRDGAVDYVLKTEGDQAIQAAIQRATEQLDEEARNERLIGQAQERMTSALVLLRKEYLLALLHGEPSTEQSRASRFAALDIPLSAIEPVYLLACRIDAWREDITADDKALFLYAINNIMDEYFAHLLRTTSLSYAADRLIWLMQPRPQLADEFPQLAGNMAAFMLETAESVQRSCRLILRISCSFIVGEEPRTWEAAPMLFDRLTMLFSRGLGQGKEMILSDRGLFAPGEEPRQEQTKIRQIPLLGHYLEQKDGERFYRLLEDIMGELERSETLQTGNALELFYSLAALFIAYMNKRDLLRALSEKTSLTPLTSIHEHASWQDVHDFFRRLAGMLFDISASEAQQETNQLVRKVHDYIRQHLHEDVSLTRLSQVVYVTPFYLSRLYKQQTGQNLSDYIVEVKLRMAKELLGNTSLKVQEIGARIGFDSPPYFIRFFKKQTMLTPQEYRDSLKR